MFAIQEDWIEIQNYDRPVLAATTSQDIPEGLKQQSGVGIPDTSQEERLITSVSTGAKMHRVSHKKLHCW